MPETIELRGENPENTDGRIEYESPEEEDVPAMWAEREVAEQIGEFASLSVEEESNVNANLSRETSGYGVYDTPNEFITGLYISRDILSEISGDEVPDSVGISISPSTQDAWDDVQPDQDEDDAEVDALIADDGSDDQDDDDDEAVVDDESDDDEEEEADELVEIDDEDLDLPEAAA